jgi:hypothetical protein
MLTKEVDHSVARAYIALAEHDDEDDDGREVKRKEVPMSLEARAVDRYLDDQEWEESERKGGRGVVIRGFPYAEGWKSRDDSHGTKRGKA